MSALDKETMNLIVELLMPHMTSGDDRVSFVRQALYDEIGFMNRIQFDGAALNFTFQLVDKSLQYGVTKSGKQAIVALLEHLSANVGIDQQTIIQGCIDTVESQSKNNDKYSPEIQPLTGSNDKPLKPLMKLSKRYQVGLSTLKHKIAGLGDDSLQLELATLTERLIANTEDERIFGSSEGNRTERARIIHALNQMALAHLALTFNDLCEV